MALLALVLGTCTLGTCTWHLHLAPVLLALELGTCTWHLHWHYGSGIGSGTCFGIGSGIGTCIGSGIMAHQHVYSRFTQESLTYDDAAGLSPAFLTAAYTI